VLIRDIYNQIKIIAKGGEEILEEGEEVEF